MAELIDLKASKVQDRQRQVGTYGTQTPLSSTAVERGSTRWLDGSSVDIEGTLSVSGTLSGGGDFDWTGEFTQSGPSTFTGAVDLNGPVEIAGDVTSTGHFTQTGPTDLNGTTTVAGDTTVTGDFTVDGPMKTTSTLDVEGITTLKNDVNVTTGKIVAGEVTIDPSFLDGSLKFANGTYIAATPNGAQFKMTGSGAGFVTVGTAQADMGAGSYGFILSATGGISMLGLPTTSNPANLYIDPSTSKIYRSTA